MAVPFYKDWYANFISHSSEKGLLVQKIGDLLQGKSHESCLEIGLGTSAFFAENLSRYFGEYWIIEKEKFQGSLPANVKFIRGDFETIKLDKQFDVILASHVVYYFNDLSASIEKMIGLLKEGGRIYFVVNGKESDYGPLKHAFGGMIGIPYEFTYDILMRELKDKRIREYTTQASLDFKSFEDLYEAMRLSFDLYPKEYEENREGVISWLKNNIKGNKFFLDQKIIEVSK